MSSAVRLKASILICVSFYTARPTLANSFTAPQGGQVIIADEEFDITWVADSTESVKIQLLYGDNIMVGNITDSTPNDGSYPWMVESSLASTRDYFLALCPLDEPDIPCVWTPNGRFGIISGSVSSTTSSSPQITSTSSSSIQTAILSPATSTSLLVVTSTTTTGAAGPTVAPSPSSQPTPTDGLPTGTIIAISITIPITAITTAALLWMTIRKKRSPREVVVQTATRPASPTEYLKPELPNDNTRAELDSHSSRDQVHELQS